MNTLLNVVDPLPSLKLKSYKPKIKEFGMSEKYVQNNCRTRKPEDRCDSCRIYKTEKISRHNSLERMH